jgi:hypothetical protein
MVTNTGIFCCQDCERILPEQERSPRREICQDCFQLRKLMEQKKYKQKGVQYYKDREQ